MLRNIDHDDADELVECPFVLVQLQSYIKMFSTPTM